MMKFTIILLLSVCVFWTTAEICRNVTECIGTTCKPTADHTHIECVENHCTCSNDRKACLTVNDCNTSARCFDRDGHRTSFHCLDGACNCIRV